MKIIIKMDKDEYDDDTVLARLYCPNDEPLDTEAILKVCREAHKREDELLTERWLRS